MPRFKTKRLLVGFEKDAHFHTITMHILPDLQDMIKRRRVGEVKRLLYTRLHSDVDRKYLVNMCGLNGDTCLFNAVHSGSTAIVETLLAVGAKVNWVNVVGHTPMYIACERNDVEMVKLLFNNGSNAFRQGNPSLLEQIKANNPRVKICQDIEILFEDAKMLYVQQQRDLAMSNLHSKLIDNDIAGVQQLIQADDHRDCINQTDENGDTILFEACRDNKFEIVRLLVKGQADINARNDKGWTALYEAIIANNTKTVKYLLSKGANTYGVDMIDLRFHAPHPISQQIDFILQGYPPSKTLRLEEEKKGVEQGIRTVKPVNLVQQRQLFQFFDADDDGFIDPIELKNKLHCSQRELECMHQVATGQRDPTTPISFIEFLNLDVGNTHRFNIFSGRSMDHTFLWNKTDKEERKRRLRVKAKAQDQYNVMIDKPVHNKNLNSIDDRYQTLTKNIYSWADGVEKRKQHAKKMKDVRIRRGYEAPKHHMLAKKDYTGISYRAISQVDLKPVDLVEQAVIKMEDIEKRRTMSRIQHLKSKEQLTVTAHAPAPVSPVVRMQSSLGRRPSTINTTITNMLSPKIQKAKSNF